MLISCGSVSSWTGKAIKKSFGDLPYFIRGQISFLVVKSCWTGCVSGLGRYQAEIYVRSYAQRDSSLWNPVVEAITIWLVMDSACHSFSLYLLVLRETDGRDSFCSCLGRDNIARSPVAQITWTGPGKAGQSTRCLRLRLFFCPGWTLGGNWWQGDTPKGTRPFGNP